MEIPNRSRVFVPLLILCNYGVFQLRALNLKTIYYHGYNLTT